MDEIDQEILEAIGEAGVETDDRRFLDAFRERCPRRSPRQRGTTAAGSAASRAAEARPVVQIDPRALSDDFGRASVASLLRGVGAGIKSIDGQPTDGEFPDCVALLTAEGTASGTLIAPNVVLTAGHVVVNGEKLDVVVGEKDTDGVATKGQAIRHGDYDGDDELDIVHDIALLFLDDRLAVEPRPLLRNPVLAAGTTLRAVGFGSDEPSGVGGIGTKRRVDMPCTAPLCTSSNRLSYNCQVDLELVCIPLQLNHKDTCPGDSGGGLLLKVGSHWRLVGLVSRAVKGSQTSCGSGGNYVRVDKYRDWIDATITARPGAAAATWV